MFELYTFEKLTNHDEHHLGSVLKLQSPGNLCPVLIFNSCHYEIKKIRLCLRAEAPGQAAFLLIALVRSVGGRGGGGGGGGARYLHNRVTFVR